MSIIKVGVIFASLWIGQAAFAQTPDDVATQETPKASTETTKSTNKDTKSPIIKRDAKSKAVEDDASTKKDETPKENKASVIKPKEAPNATKEEDDEALTPEERKAIEAATKADAKAIEDEKPQVSPVIQPVMQQAQNMLPEISLITDIALSAFSGEPDQLGAHDPNKTGFTLQQVEMHLASNVDPYFRLEANIVFAQFGVEVEEAYATTLALPGNLQLRAGQFLTRFGRLNPTHPHSWDFLDQPLVNGKFFGGEGSRGLGVEGSWLTPLPWFAEVLVSANQADGACCARSFYGGQDRGVNGLEDFLYTTSLKQFFETSDHTMLLWGLSAQFGPNPTGNGNRTEIYGTDLTFRYRPQGGQNRAFFYWQTEAMLRRRQVPFGVLQDLGWYSQMVWQMNQNWALGVRYEYVQGVDDDAEWLDPQWIEDRQRVAMQSTFYPSHFSRLRVQLMWDDLGAQEAIFGAMVGLEVVIGSHGAHAF